MRMTQTTNDLRVHAIAGTYVVMLGFDLPEADCAGLLGFSLHCQDLTENEAYYLFGIKTSTDTDPGFPADSPCFTHTYHKAIIPGRCLYFAAPIVRAGSAHSYSGHGNRVSTLGLFKTRALSQKIDRVPPDFSII